MTEHIWDAMEKACESAMTPEEKQQRLQSLRDHYEMTDDDVVLLATYSHVISPDIGEWLILIDRGDLLTADLDPSEYWRQVKAFNEMYKLPTPRLPTDTTNADLDNFKSIMLEEVEEVEEIKAITDPVERMTALSDWLGDIIVYCSTKAATLGLPTPVILDIIMRSNMSKLGADGKPIYDERGKVMKGPGYWKPEPQIKRFLELLHKYDEKHR